MLPTTEDYNKLELPYPKCVGFYSYAGRRVVSVDRGRTLVHEFTHALHHADMAASRQRHPIWITEGLATLFEACTITPSGLVPHVDIRLVTIQKAVREKTVFPLRELLSMGQKPFMKDAAVAYAQSRYLMYYLYEKGHLDDFYKRYKQTFTRDPHGIAAFEAAAGNKLAIIDRDWQKWVMTLKLPWLSIAAGSAGWGWKSNASHKAPRSSGSRTAQPPTRPGDSRWATSSSSSTARPSATRPT